VRTGGDTAAAAPVGRARPAMRLHGEVVAAAGSRVV
jgi:hypothetical protein